MNRKLSLETLSLVLLLIAFPIISTGATHSITWLWWVGLVAIVVAGLLPIWTRFMDHSTDKPRDIGMDLDERVS